MSFQLFKNIVLSAVISMPILITNTNTANTAGDKDHPDGRYCGEVLHAGYIVKSELKLETDKTGHLKGVMHYNDNGAITDGNVEELDIGKGQTRTLQWRDKYGYGYAILQFDKEYNSFKGLWGTGIEAPSHPWNGSRCNDYTS